MRIGPTRRRGRGGGSARWPSYGRAVRRADFWERAFGDAGADDLGRQSDQPLSTWATTTELRLGGQCAVGGEHSASSRARRVDGDNRVQQAAAIAAGRSGIGDDVRRGAHGRLHPSPTTRCVARLGARGGKPPHGSRPSARATSTTALRRAEPCGTSSAGGQDAVKRERGVVGTACGYLIHVKSRNEWRQCIARSDCEIVHSFRGGSRFEYF